jgi:hypothetical protein
MMTATRALISRRFASPSLLGGWAGAANLKGLQMKTELTGAQVRMARAFLRWSVAELATRADVGISTVQRIEATDDPVVRDDLDWRASARGRSIRALRQTLIRAGITLLPDDGNGVGIRGKARKAQVR